MKRLALLTLAFVLLLVPMSKAWTLGAGVEIEQSPTTIILGHDIEVTTDAYFDGNIFYIAPFGFEWHHSTPHTWVLENWSAPLNVTFVGNALEDASLSFYNFQGIYQVTGLAGFPSFLINGPSFELFIPMGTTNFTVRLASLSGASPIRLTLSAAWNPVQDTAFAVASLLDNFGNAWSTTGMTSTLLRPDGSAHSTINMTETIVDGVYNANHNVSSSEPNGTWTVTSRLGTAVDSYAIIKQGAPITENDTVELTTAFDSWIPLLIWGGVMILMLWAEAWAPAAMCLINLAAALPATPIYGRPASIMFFCISLFLHVVITVLHRRNWFRKTGDE